MERVKLYGARVMTLEQLDGLKACSKPCALSPVARIQLVLLHIHHWPGRSSYRTCTYHLTGFRAKACPHRKRLQPTWALQGRRDLKRRV